MFISDGTQLTAGASAVVGVVVSEISLGVKFGVGRLILSYGQEATTDPPKLFTAVFGAAALGLVMAAIYRQLLLEIQRDGFQVLHQRTSLTPLRKLWLAWSTWVRA